MVSGARSTCTSGIVVSAPNAFSPEASLLATSWSVARLIVAVAFRPRADGNAYYQTGCTMRRAPLTFVEAAEWYQKAALQGHRTAQYSLGVCHFKGVGVAESYSEGMTWY